MNSTINIRFLFKKREILDWLKSKWITAGMDCELDGVWFDTAKRDFTLLRNIQTSSGGIHSAYYSMSAVSRGGGGGGPKTAGF
jgi:hypothetical protein